ncbi:hypothetical protein D3871_14760 [Noviherbaspirillum saxi]|uniref:Uncharacterized protein n=1 Tax=Noviherbaspirillum saxi TaxID=2320863 RepID=A0A3A3FY88_9BURK|nr:hypothetical protein D3871_14760 [Noviherbaspirillum saxi]
MIWQSAQALCTLLVLPGLRPLGLSLSMAVNLIMTTGIAGVTMRSTIQWAVWMALAMLTSLASVTAVPQLALWLPQQLGY